MTGARVRRSSSRTASSTTVRNTIGATGPSIAASSSARSCRASSTPRRNGTSRRSKGTDGNCSSSALPIVSTLMPVESEMKKTGTAGGLVGGPPCGVLCGAVMRRPRAVGPAAMPGHVDVWAHRNEAQAVREGPCEGSGAPHRGSARARQGPRSPERDRAEGGARGRRGPDRPSRSGPQTARTAERLRGSSGAENQEAQRNGRLRPPGGSRPGSGPRAPRACPRG